MELDPLAEIEFGMLMAVMIRLGQGMVDFERGGKRREGQQHRNEGGRSYGPQHAEPAQCRTTMTHKRGTITQRSSLVNGCQGFQSRATVA